MQLDLFQWTPAGHIDPENLPAPVPEPVTHWPNGLNPDDFDEDQRGILSEWYIRNLQNQIQAFYRLLRATSPGSHITPTTVGINAAIIAKIMKLTPDLAETPWGEMASELHVRPSKLFQQKNAIIDALRLVNKQLPRKFKN